MATVILARHGRSTANTSGVLAGRAPGVGLDEHGRRQVRDAAARIGEVRLVRAVTSPLQRCRQTAAGLLAEGEARPAPLVDAGLQECDYGQWQGHRIVDLAKDPLWRTVQSHPSAVTFPGGESLAAMQARVVAAVRRHDAEVEAEHGPDTVWLAVSHGDLIKAVLADALGMHLDLFQRLHVDPASLSVVRYTTQRPLVLATNTTAGALGWLDTPAKQRGRRAGRAGDGVVGGGAGPA